MIVIDNLKQVANQIETERGVDKSILYSAIETALASACRKHLRSQENIVCDLNVEDGTISFFTAKTVVKDVEDDSIEISLTHNCASNSFFIDPRELLRSTPPLVSNIKYGVNAISCSRLNA